MKTNVKTKKDFDAVEWMQSRRAEIAQDIEGMSFEEEKKYFEESANQLKKYKTVGDH